MSQYLEQNASRAAFTFLVIIILDTPVYEFCCQDFISLLTMLYSDA